MNEKYTGRSLSVPAGLGIGLGISLAMVLVGTALIAKLIDSETMSWENVGYGIMGMLLAASFVGSLAAYGKIKRQRLLVCLMSGAVLFATLLSLTALFFGGQYDGIVPTFLLILAGSSVAGLLGLRQGRGVGKKRMRRLKK